MKRNGSSKESSSVAAVRVLPQYRGSDSEGQQLEELEKDDSVMSLLGSFELIKLSGC